jgi:hypothetical protein
MGKKDSEIDPGQSAERPPSGRPGREFVLWAVVASVFFAAALAYGAHVVHDHVDLKIFLRAARLAGQGLNPYDRPAFAGAYQYAPVMLMPFIPLAGLQEGTASWIWHCALWSCLLGSAVAVLRSLRKAGWSEVQARWGLVAGLLLFSGAVVRELKCGQANLPALLLLSWSVYLCLCNRQVSSGFLAGAACAVKLYPGVALLYFASKGQWRAGLGWLAAVAVAAMLPMVIFGPGRTFCLTRTWWDSYVAASIGGAPPLWDNPVRNQSFAAFVYRLWGGPSAGARVSSLAANALLLGLSLLVLWRPWREAERSRRRSLSGWGVVFCLCVLANPVAQKHVFVFLLLPWVLAVVLLREASLGWPARALLASALIVEVAYDLSGERARLWLQSHSSPALSCWLLWAGLAWACRKRTGGSSDPRGV